MSGSLRCFWQLAAQQRPHAASKHRNLAVCGYAVTQSAKSSQMADGEDAAMVLRVTSQDIGKGKLRLDAFLTAQVPQASRGKLQACIKAGNVVVNGKQELKTSSTVRAGDDVQCVLLDAPVMQAIPEDIPLNIVYEDAHVMVVNKEAGMVVHPAPGHATGTLVNAFLHHCGLPPVPVEADTAPDESSEQQVSESDDEASMLPVAPNASLRPGLLVIAKDEYSLVHLSDQFRARSVQRTYQSITLGCPSPAAGEVSTNIGRDSADRKKMAAFPLGSSRGRYALSGYRVVQALGDGSSALVEWQLQTGRTHQIRVHAKKIGHSLFGDDAYGGAGGSAVSAVGRGKSLRYARHTKHQHSKAIIMSCLIPERVSATGLDACVNLSYTVSCGVM
ncbi:TPA: hypothetical protein ACH3X3_008761 [Trebouxia sp. C0006]